MTGYPSIRDVDRYTSMQTPVLEYSYIYSNFCISLWTQITAPDAELTLTLGLYGGKDSKGGNSGSKFVKLLNLNNKEELKWSRHTVDIDENQLKDYHEINFQISAKTAKALTMVAIDDIQLTYGSCDYTSTFTCTDKKSKISSDKLCNFYKDCADGSDEKNCGECDFESGNCGWKNVTSYSSSAYDYSGLWIPVIAQQTTNGPIVDGSGNANGHYLLLSQSRYKKSNIITSTILTRDYRDYLTEFKDAYFTCTMTFDYYVSSSRPYKLANLQVLAGYDEDSAILKNYYRATNSEDSWQKGTTFIGGFPGSFIVHFVASRFVDNETVAVDNIQFHDCSIPVPKSSDADCPGSSIKCKTTHICIDPSDQCDFEDNCGDNSDESYQLCVVNADPKMVPSCAFEKSLELCGFVYAINTTNPTVFNWRLTRGYDYNIMQYSGPTTDHTT